MMKIAFEFFKFWRLVSYNPKERKDKYKILELVGA